MSPRKDNHVSELSLVIDKIDNLHTDFRELRVEVAEVKDIAIQTREQAIKTNGRVLALEKKNDDHDRINVEEITRISKLENAVFTKKELAKDRKWWARFFADYGIQLLLAAMSFITFLMTRQAAATVAAHAVLP